MSTDTLTAVQTENTADGMYFEDFREGDTGESHEVEAERDAMIAYALAHDPWPIHTDEDFAKTTPAGGLTASFGYVVSLFLDCVHTFETQRRPQTGFLGALEWRIRFHEAVHPGDRLRVNYTVESTRLTSKRDRGVVTVQHKLLNQSGDVAIATDVVGMYLTRPR